MDQAGLTSREAAERLEKFGPNEITDGTGTKAWKLLLQQFISPLILILLAAAAVSVILGLLPGQSSNIVDAALILGIVLISGFFGFYQDYKAEKTIEALQRMSRPHARVIRDGHEKTIFSNEIVPGDLLLLEAGDIVAADGEVGTAIHLEVDESILTGESEAIHKSKGDFVAMNSYVTSGNAQVRVTATGMNSQLGKIAAKMDKMEQAPSSFQTELKGLGKKLSWLTVIVAIVVGLVGILKFGWYQGLLTGISLAVAAVPEGLPAVVVLALAAGAGVLFKRNALIRRLAVAESVGAIDVICTDKTGTITRNEMQVTEVDMGGESQPFTDFTLAETHNEAENHLFRCAGLCSDVHVDQKEKGERILLGEQTEVALYSAAEKALGEGFAAGFSKIDEIPFNSQRKMMSVLLEAESGQLLVYTKGAPEVILQKCKYVHDANGQRELTQEMRDQILERNKGYAQEALRVLGFAWKPGTPQANDLEQDLVWLGLLAMVDPPREEAGSAIRDCYTAGIRVVMITGDNPTTAQAIAKRVGLQTTGAMTGVEIDRLNDQQLHDSLEAGINVFARTNPMHKLRILESLQRQHRVAMTGDGVNDALAIKKANVGIAMGKKGTEVAKQASDLILLDDNFSTIRDAVLQGRTIFRNIRKFIDYLLTCNIAEVLVIFVATLFFQLDGPVLFAVQILWINLLTDGLVALSLGLDPPASDTMLKKPRNISEPLINRRLTWLIGAIGIKKMIVLLIAFWLALPMGEDTARTVLLTGFVLFEFVRIGAIRYEEKLSWWANKWLVWALLLSVVLHLIIVYSPLNSFFLLVPLGVIEWAILAGGVLIGYLLAILITHIVITRIPENDSLQP